MNIPDGLQSSLPNGVNLSFLPAHIVKRALALSKPVGEADEPLLIETIVEALQKDKNSSYKAILNGLHGKKGHSASLWKDYYLDNKKRIDLLVRNRKKAEQKPTVTHASKSEGETEAGASVKKPSTTVPAIKKPSVSAGVKRQTLATGPVSAALASATAPRRRSRSKTGTPVDARLPPMTDIPASGGRRSTLNSLTAFDAVYNSRLPAPHTEIKIPAIPSRSPSPPTLVVPLGMGNKFTEEDRRFFIKYIQRRLLKEPNLTRKELCEGLAEKAPHHGVNSWMSHWSNNHDLPDKIMNAAANGLWPYGPKEGDKPPQHTGAEKRGSPLKRPNYRESSSSGVDHSDDDYDNVDEDSEEDEQSDANEPLRRYSSSEMSEPKHSFNEADKYIVAKYIAGFPGFYDAKALERWERFERKHPQRNVKSWQEYFRRYEKSIRRVVRQIQREEQSQRVRPTGEPPRKKRREESSP